jgi:hypothetical protein
MNDLDDKLKQIFEDCTESNTIGYQDDSGDEIERDYLDIPRAIEQIKQAFKDVGYILLQEKSPARNGKIIPLMTGLEWYNKFKKELEDITDQPHFPELLSHHAIDSIGIALNAAKKAADIE